MYAASRIRDGDPESWFHEFTALGERVEARALTSLAGGHRVSARESFLRCYAYYRGAPAFLNPRSDERYRKAYERGQACFLRVNNLLDVPLEPISVPFEGKTLPGYFARVDQSGQARRTLFMVGGGDTFVEDLYFYIVPAALRRNYNFFVDLPGQGALPWEGLHWRADMETPMKVVLDKSIKRCCNELH